MTHFGSYDTADGFTDTVNLHVKVYNKIAHICHACVIFTCTTVLFWEGHTPVWEKC